jgi:Zn finger protein HypA/HybF involved in hydrogenase expression
MTGKKEKKDLPHCPTCLNSRVVRVFNPQTGKKEIIPCPSCSGDKIKIINN